MTTRIANVGDVDGIWSLFEFWNNYKVDPFNLENPYSKEDIRRIILESFVSVVSDDDAEGANIVSFYFVNHYLDTGNVLKRKMIIENKVRKGELPPGKYALSLLSATHMDYFGRGLNRDALNLLREIAVIKYDYFIGVMCYDNEPTHRSSLKMGWRHFGDIGIGLLAVIGTNKERNEILDRYRSIGV